MKKLQLLGSSLLTSIAPAVLVILMTISTQRAFAQCNAVSGTIRGAVFNDNNNDGKFDVNENGMGNALVTVYDAFGSTAGFAPTLSDGSYIINGLTDGVKYKVVIETIANVKPSIVGLNNGSSVQFVTAPACNVSTGYVDYQTACSSNPTMLTTCFVVENSVSQNIETLVGFNHDLSGNASKFAMYGETGAIWGIAYKHATREIFTSAFVKQNTSLKDGPGAIFKTSINGLSNTTSTFVKMSDLGIDVGSITVSSTDCDYGKGVGKIGLGSLILSPDEQYLYTINLNNKSLIKIPTINPTQANTTETIIPNPGCSNGEYVPFALKYYNGKIYIGITCTAETSKLEADSKATVYEYDPTSATFTNIFSTPYLKGYWHDDATDFSKYQQWFTDLDFTDDGNMILSFGDRIGHRFCNPATYSQLDHQKGDILMAWKDNGVWKLENNGHVGVLTGSGAGSGQGPGGGEFFGNDYWPFNATYHPEVSLGSIFVLPLSGSVISTVYDPLINSYSGGVHSYSTHNGLLIGGKELYTTQYYNSPTSANLFGKATGFGDLIAKCGITDIEIGNFVWNDVNENGLQDAGENPITGLTLELLDDQCNVVQTQTTDPAGNYLFKNVNPGTQYYISIPSSNFDSNSDHVTVNSNEYAFTTHANGFNLYNSDVDLSGNVCPQNIIAIQSDYTDHTLDIGLVKVKGFDLALRKVVVGNNLVKENSDIQFRITVFNQGGGEARQVEITDYIPAGYAFNAAQNPDWNYANGVAKTTINQAILPGQSADVNIVLKIISGDLSKLVNISEIESVKDINGNTPTDVDSNPDSNAGNDAGGEVLSSTDDKIDGDGIDDEDDADPAVPRIFDLALKAELDENTCTKSGDLITINVSVINQGNTNASSFNVVNYEVSELIFNPAINPGWSKVGDKIYYQGGVLLAGQKVIIPLKMNIVNGVAIEQVTNYFEISNQIPQGSQTPFDFDSSPDNINDNDSGGQPFTPYDNYLSGNGINDEDDHDPVVAGLAYVDLAVKLTTDKRKIELYDEVCFTAIIYNQGTLPVKEVNLINYLPKELELVDANWIYESDNKYVSTILFDDPLVPGETYQTKFCTHVVLLENNSLITDYLEIEQVKDVCDDDVSSLDIDSKADDNRNNDQGGLPNTSTDNQINSSPPVDEDDHDPAQVISIQRVPAPEPLCGLCLGNATNGQNGQFRKTFQFLAPPGMTWYVDQAINIYSDASPNPPALPTNFIIGPAGTLMTEQFVNATQSLYVLVGRYESNTLYTLRFRSTQDDYELYTGGGCSYTSTPVNGLTSLCTISSSNYNVPSIPGGYITSLSGGGIISAQNADQDAITVTWGGVPGIYTLTFEPSNPILCQSPGILQVAVGFADLALACRSNINVSIDADCSLEITPSMIVAGPVNPNAPYNVMLLDPHGNPIPGNIINGSHLGKTITAKLIEGCSGNSCWGFIKVEDKSAPKIICEDVTVSCFKAAEYPGPTTYDNCDVNVKLNVLDSFITPLYCDANFTQIIHKSYQAVDSWGNKSKVCEQVISVKRINFADITYPADLTMANALTCDGFLKDKDGHPHPSVTGIPLIQGVPLYPDFNLYCNVIASYTDNDLGWIGCTRKIMRTWRVYESSCTNVSIDEYVQTIIITDNNAPVIVCPAAKTVSASYGNCEALVVLSPIINITDDCTTSFTIDIQYPGGIFLNQNGGAVSLPAGVHTITYAVYDQCLNRSTCSTTVTVEDKFAPTAICDAADVVSLTSSGTAYMYAHHVDGGSYDACGIDFLEIRRMDRGVPCGAAIEAFGPFVDFCCADVNNDIMIELRVWDAAGNSNTCMVSVTVQDKTVPSIVCPPNTTISCEVVYNLNDLSLYGNATAVDACGADVSSTALAFVDQCRVGRIERTFTADDGANIAQCVQTISIVNYNPFNPLTINWPDDYATINGCSILDLSPDNLPAQFAKPIFIEGFCDLVAATHEDKYYPFVDGSGTCFKILRTWYVIDWCRKDLPNYVPIVYQQTIKVSNTVAPVITSSLAALTQCTPVDNCLESFINLSATATDDCTPGASLRWRYQIDFNYNGTFTPETSIATGLGATVNASGIYPVGSHYILWSFEDICGNVVSRGQSFTINNCNGPQAVCIEGASIDLTPMDLDGDGIVETEMACITASTLNASSSHICGYPLKYSFSQDVNDTTLCFDCFNIGENTVTLYVTDPYGLFDICEVTIDVQDNNNVDFCPDLEDCIVFPPDRLVTVCNQGTTPVILNSFTTVSPGCLCNQFTITFSDAPITPYPNATCTIIERTWSVVFKCGNHDREFTKVQKITRRNLIAPQIVCPANITVSANANTLCQATVTLGLPTLSGAECSDITVTHNSPFAPQGSNASGTYPLGSTKVIFTVTDACGHSNTCQTTILVNSSSVPVAITGNNVICLGQSTTLSTVAVGTYAWNTNPVQTTSSITVSPSQTTTYVLTVTNANGCTATASRTVTVNPLPNANITGNNVICVGQSTTLTATGGGSYVWNTNPAQITATITVSPAQTTTYIVTVTNGNGCTATSSRTVTVNPLPTAAISGNNVICLGQSTTLTATGGVSYSWNTVPVQTTAAITVSPTQTRTYIVTVTNANGCTATASRTVTVNALPTANITGNNVICVGESTTLTATGGVSYAWNTNPVQTTAAITVSPIVTTTYVVTVTNANGCTATASRTVNVNSNTTPIAICMDVTISIQNQGTVILLPQQVDGGSTAECNGTIINRTVTPNTFDCADVGIPQTVTLTVTSNGGSSTCTAIVTIEDNAGPVIVCPDDLTLNCNQFNGDLASLPLPTVGDMCGVDTLIISDNIATNTCNIGEIVRSFIALDIFGNPSAECVYVVTILPSPAPLTLSDIDFPDPLVIISDCGSSTPANTGQTTVDLTGLQCVNVSITFTDQNAQVNVCHDTIVRHWVVTDSCAVGTNLPNGGVFTFNQTIIINDNSGPLLIAPADLTVTAANGPCTVFVNLSGFAVSDCSTPIIVSNNSPFADNNNSLNASGSYPEGVYQIILTATDACGNTSVDTVNLTVFTNPMYSRICHKIVRVLNDQNTVTVNVKEHMTYTGDCDNIIHRESYSLTDINDTLRVYDCDDIGDVITYIFFYDDGVFVDSCRTLTTIQTGPVPCNNNINLVRGEIITEALEPVSDAIIRLEVSNMGDVRTNDQGKYQFPTMDSGGTYRVYPTKDGNYMEGVSTLDMIFIQRHVLKTQILNSPYKLVAADVNNDKKISTTDIVELRKNILGAKVGFTNNQSWKAIDASYVFPDPKNPFIEPYPLYVDIENLSGLNVIDFTGVKIGDVNGSFRANLHNSTLDPRNKINLVFDDAKVKKGEKVVIPVKMSVAQKLYGMQISFNMTDLELNSTSSETFKEDLEFNNLGFETRIIMSEGTMQAIENGGNVFVLECTALEDGWLHNMIDLSGVSLTNEVYDENLHPRALSLEWNNIGSEELVLEQNTPNPWKDKTNINFSLPSDCNNINLVIKDASGKLLMQKIISGRKGVNFFELNGDMIGDMTGLMFIELSCESLTMNRKMIRLK